MMIRFAKGGISGTFFLILFHPHGEKQKEVVMLSKHVRGKNGFFTSKLSAIFLASLFVALLSQNLQAGEGGGTEFCADSFCTNTARAAFKACRHEFRDDFWIEVGKCNNLSDFEARIECLQEVRSGFAEERWACKDQFDARLEICDELGEAPYDPEINNHP